MSVIRVCGVDPGKVLTWTIVDVSPTVCHWVDSGTVSGTPLAMAHALHDRVGDNLVELVAFELYDPGEWIGGARAGAAVATWQTGARAMGALEAWLVPCVLYSAQTWRRGTVGTRSPKDSEIRHWLEQWGKVELPKRTNADSRDAAGLAIHAGRVAMKEGGR